VLKKGIGERVAVRNVSLGEGLGNQTRRDETSLTESEAETRCIRAWRKSEVLKNQEAESNERQYQEITSRGRGPINDTPFYTFSVAERAVCRISYRDKGAKVK